ncbi:WD40 repeat-like protein [Rhizoclosmatium globosum]|uniref:Serine-threonine kinase receptor-associated protein n=1 Tax=Rhizoclosmatium globosum TaxID=329046 RepID=A0A1Y2D2D3_9FUNG|nr:WD40 repeat-like protein [Rhizoclosmatium globosum]|eukprot:ORY53284.1 WD40 repeat-like protein [Rhizoclosmatium globosum]
MSSNTPQPQPPFGSATASTESSGSAKQVSLTCTGHTRPVNDLSFSSFVATGDYFLLSACKDSVPILRKGSTGDWVGSFKGHKGAVWGTRITPNASLSVTGSADFTAKVWDNVTGQPIVSFEHQHIVKTVDVSDDGRYVLTGGNEKKLKLFDQRSPTSSTTPVRTLEGLNNDVKTCLLDTTHGLVFNGDGKEMRVWDLRKSAQVSSRIFEQEVSNLRFSWDRKYIIATAGRRVFFYNAITASLEKQFDVSVDASCAALHPSELKFVVGGTKDLWVREYDFQTGSELEVYKGHHGPIHCTSFSPDGQLYATGSEDGTIRLWQTFPGTTYGLWQAA